VVVKPVLIRTLTVLKCPTFFWCLRCHEKTKCNREISWQQKNDKNRRKTMPYTLCSVSFYDYLTCFSLSVLWQSESIRFIVSPGNDEIKWKHFYNFFRCTAKFIKTLPKIRNISRKLVTDNSIFITIHHNYKVSTLFSLHQYFCRIILDSFLSSFSTSKSIRPNLCTFKSLRPNLYTFISLRPNPYVLIYTS